MAMAVTEKAQLVGKSTQGGGGGGGGGGDSDGGGGERMQTAVDTWMKETEMREFFLESIIVGAREGDVKASQQSFRELELAGLMPGPSAHHGVIVAYCIAEDVDGAMRALLRELGAGVRPLPQTFLAVLRLLGKSSLSKKGEQVLGTMEELEYDCRLPWLTLVGELERAGDLQEANRVFLKGLDSGMTPTQIMYDTLVKVNCENGNHEAAIKILRHMELKGTLATTFHYNCLLLCEANANVPHMCAITFDSMKYGREEMKPDTESYNWLLQSWIRHDFGDCLQETIDVLGDMIEDHKTVQPNIRTYVLIVECFVKHNKVDEAIRYFKGLRCIPNSMPALHQGGEYGDPLSLYLRSTCRTGKIGEMILALEAMERDNQPIPARAMIVNKYRRTLVSSWIEPMDKEGDSGIEIDYVARYITEGGLTGTRPRWRPPISDDEDEPIPRQPDHEGYRFAAPAEESFKQACLKDWQAFNVRLLERLLEEGVEILGPDASEEDMKKVVQRLRIEVMGGNARNLQKPKAASKMLVAELKAELEAQGLSTEGTRPALYQRVQKARRIARARGRPIWVPPIKEVSTEEEELVEGFLKSLRERASTGDWSIRPQAIIGKPDEEETTDVAGLDDLDEGTDADEDEDDVDDDVTPEDLERNRRLQKMREEGVAEEEEEEEEEAKGEATVIMGVKIGGMRLLDHAVKEEKLKSEAMIKFQEEWFSLSKEEKLQTLIDQRWFDRSEAYTVADVWGWTWEENERNKLPERWSEELELELALQVLDKVIKLGGNPTASDCAVLLRTAMNASRPDKVAALIATTHQLGHSLGLRIYAEAVELCLDRLDRESARAILAEMETVGLDVPEELKSKVCAVSIENNKPKQQSNEPGEAGESDNADTSEELQQSDEVDGRNDQLDQLTEP